MASRRRGHGCNPFSDMRWCVSGLDRAFENGLHRRLKLLPASVESGGNLLGSSRVVTVRLDLATRVATLVKSDDQPEGQVAQLMGNAQTTAGGDLLVGWGALPYISEFSPSGHLLFNAKLQAGGSTYRAYLLPWHPATEEATNG